MGGCPTVTDLVERTDDTMLRGGDGRLSSMERLQECRNVCRDVISQESNLRHP